MNLFPSRLAKLMRWLGPLLLVILLVYVDPRQLMQVGRSADLRWVLLAFVLNFPQLGLKAFRWWLLVRWQSISLNYGRALTTYFSCLLLGFLTPGRIGEMAKAATLRYESNVPLAQSLSSVVVDRVFDLSFLIALGAVGVVRFSVVGALLPWPMFIALCTGFLLPLFLLKEQVVNMTGRKLVMFPLFRSRANIVEQRIRQFSGGLATLSPARIGVCVFLTVAAYSVFFIQCGLCAFSLGFSVPWVDLVLLMGATNVIGFLPISISNLGTREACLIYFLARLAIPQSIETAIAFGLVQFLVLFIGGGLIGFACWSWSPLGLRRAFDDLRGGSTQEKSG